MTSAPPLVPCSAAAPSAATNRTGPGEATFIVFSGEMDRLLGALTLATTAAATGMKTTLFFTFWGLTAVRRDKRRSRGSLIDRMFGFMLPAGTGGLPTSRVNFLGLGPRLFRWRMAKKRMPDLDTLIEQARALGVRMLACEASADVLGLAAEDLRDGIEIAGATSCLRDAARSEVAMFI
ncbi:MAG: DsrE/DsrF/DrsH-like family protein [Planctomycetes bacterium]|nr:DsrE/DsrF/DrsH-like family protein [Planctomycetota bacterium]